MEGIPFFQIQPLEKVPEALYYDGIIKKRKDEDIYDIRIKYINKGLGPAINITTITPDSNIENFIFHSTPFIPSDIISVGESAIQVFSIIDKKIKMII